MTKPKSRCCAGAKLPMFAAIVGWILALWGGSGPVAPHWYLVLYFIATVARQRCASSKPTRRASATSAKPLPRFLQRKLREAYRS